MTTLEINHIKQSVRIEDVIGRQVKLTRKGKYLLGLCPFHTDHHPSFSVNPEKQFFTCYACGQKGDVIAFVQKMEGCSFVEAVGKLTGNQWIHTPTPSASESRKEASGNDPKERQEGGTLPLDSFLNLLMPAASGYSDLTPTWLDFEVGTSPVMVPDAWKAMRNRLVFPIRNEEGVLVGFGARRLTDHPDGPKYINSATSRLYRKNEILYGLHLARKKIEKQHYAILVEGYKDVLAMHAAGFRHTVALCGTALCEGQIRLLQKYTSRVVVMLDSDEAGRKASEKALPALRMQGIKACEVELPEGDDPDSLFRRWGKESFTAYLREQLTLLAPSEETLLLEGIREKIQTLSGITDSGKRLYLLRRLSVGMAHLTGLSLRQGRPGTVDGRWL